MAEIKRTNIVVEYITRTDKARADVKKLRDDTVGLGKAVGNSIESMEHFANVDLTGDLIDEMKGLTTSLREQQTAADESVQANEAIAESSMKAADSNKEQSKSLTDLVRGITVFGVNVGDVIDKGNEWLGNLRNIGRTLKETTQLTASQQARVNALGTGFGSGARTATALLRGLNLLKVAFKGLGIGVVVTAITALFGYFTRTTEGADKLAKVLGGVSGVFDVLATRAAQLAGAIVKLFSGDVTEAAEQAQGAFSNVREEIEATIEANNRLVDIQREILNERENQASQEAELNRIIKEQNKIGEDTTRSFEEREKAIELSLQKSEELLNLRQSFNVQEQDALREQIALEGNQITNQELRIELDQKRAEFINRETEILELQTTQQNKLNALRKEREAQIQREIEQQEKINAQLAEAERIIEKLEIQLIPDNIERQRQQIVFEAEETKRQFEEKIRSAFEDGILTDAARQKIQQYGELIDQATRAALAPIEGLLAERADLDIIVNPTINDVALDETDEALVGVKQKLQDLISDGVFGTIEQEAGNQQFDSFFDLITGGNIDGDLGQLRSAVRSAFNSIQQLAASLNQQLIDELDAQIESETERITELQEVADKGGAEQLEAAEKRQARLIEQREEALEQQRRITATNIAADQAAAVAAGALAIANSLKIGGPVGIASAIATGVALAVQTANAIAQINALFDEVPSFRVGVENLTEQTATKVPSVSPKSLDKDGILIQAHKNERILTKEQNEPLLKWDVKNEDIPFLVGVGLGKVYTPPRAVSDTVMQRTIVNMNADRTNEILTGFKAEMLQSQKAMQREFQSLTERMDKLHWQVRLDKDGFAASVGKQMRRNKAKRMR